MSTPQSRRVANAMLLNSLHGLWERVPDQRFGQLIMNLSREPDGFADTWEWSLSDWHSRIREAAETWAKPVDASAEDECEHHWIDEPQTVCAHCGAFQ